MAIKALNSVAGFSVGETPSNIILANGDITTTNISTTGVTNLNAVGNVKITGGTAGQVISTDGSGNLSFISVSSSSISNGSSNVNVLENGNITFSSAGNANVVVITGTGEIVNGNLSTTGNAAVLGIKTDNYYYANGDPISFAGSYNNSNVSSFLALFGSNTITTTGNISVGNVNTGGVVNATGNVSGGNLTTGGVVTATGNITGANLITAGNVFAQAIVQNASTYDTRVELGSSSGVIAITSDGNSTSFKPSGQVELGGVSQIVGGTFGGSGITLGTSQTDIFQNRGGNVTVQVGTGGSIAKTWTFAQDGSLTSPGAVSATGNVTGANLVTSGVVTATGNISGGNIDTGGVINATGNATAGNLVTGGLVTATGNVTGANLVTGGLVTATGNVTGANLVTGGLVTATGTITGGNLETAGLLSVGGNANVGNIGAAAGVFTTVTGTLTTAAQPNITSVGTLTSLGVSGDISGANIVANTKVVTDSITNKTAGNLVLTATSNIVLSTTGVISAGTSIIANVGTPTSDADAATKAYVDNLVSSGIHYHAPVRVESPIALNATYNNGTAGVGATLTNAGTNAALVVDGVTLNTADRVLVYQQTDATQNGVYVVTVAGNGSTAWVLTRAADADTYSPSTDGGLDEGSYFFVQAGVTGAGESYVCSTVGVITFGTTLINFAQFSKAPIYTAGTGLTLTNEQFSISNTTVTAGSYGDGDSVATFTVNAQGQLTVASNVAISSNAANLTGTTLNSSIVNSSLTSVGTLGSLNVSGNANIGNIGTAGIITATGTVTAGNLATLGTLSVGGNANVGNLGTTGLATVGSLTVSGVSDLGAVGNITITGGSANYLLQTNGSGTLTWVAPPSTATIANGTSNVNIATADGNVSTSVGGTANVLVVTATGADVTGTISATGNITGANIATGGLITATGNITGANIATGGLITATGNGTFGNVSTAGVVTATGNITGGNLVTGGTISATGNISGGNITTAGVVQGATANFTTSVTQGTTVTTVGTVTTSSITANQTIASFSVTDVTGVEYLVKGVDATGAKYSVATVHAVTDGSTVDYAVYGGLFLGATTGTLSVNLNGGFIRLAVTPSSSNSTVWTTQYRLI
jgi:hypothetical protein